MRQTRISHLSFIRQRCQDYHSQGTIYRNAQLRYTQIVYCSLWEECKKTQCPHTSWRERTKALIWYYNPTKNKLIYIKLERIHMISGQYGNYNSNIFLFHPLGPFPSKWCVAPEFYVLISFHCSTQISCMRYGGSWSIYFLTVVIRFFWLFTSG